jgi:hypothetical protein
MWPFAQSKIKEAHRLGLLLAQIKLLVERSAESDWTPFTPAEVCADLAVAIAQIERRETIDVRRLTMLFLPTGPLQEIAMSAGWADDYLKLSSEFDALTKTA